MEGNMREYKSIYPEKFHQVPVFILLSTFISQVKAALP